MKGGDPMWLALDLGCPSCHRPMVIRELALNEAGGMTYIATCPACDQSYRAFLDTLAYAAEVGQRLGFTQTKVIDC